MAAFSAGPIQKGRWQPLLWPVRARRGAAADVEFHAQKIWCAHLWPGRTYGAGIEMLDLSITSATERDQRGGIPRACRAGVRFSGGTFAGNDLDAGKRN